jgi:hypothetical protein
MQHHVLGAGLVPVFMLASINAGSLKSFYSVNILKMVYHK